MRNEPTPEDWREAGEMMLESERKLWEERPPQPEDFKKPEPQAVKELQPVKKEEKPEITAPVMDLYDLFNFTRKRTVGSIRSDKKAGRQDGQEKQAQTLRWEQPVQPTGCGKRRNEAAGACGTGRAGDTKRKPGRGVCRHQLGHEPAHQRLL